MAPRRPLGKLPTDGAAAGTAASDGARTSHVKRWHEDLQPGSMQIPCRGALVQTGVARNPRAGCRAHLQGILAPTVTPTRC